MSCLVFISVLIILLIMDNISHLLSQDGRQPSRIFSQNDVAAALHPFFMSRKAYLTKYEYNWRTRLRMEFQKRKTYFLTLTFDDDHLPSGSPQEQLEEVTRLLQLFWKRLRSFCEYYDIGLNFKYYVVTENGEEFGRLHCHALVFADGSNKKVLNQRTARPLFALIEKCWKCGRTQIRVADEKKIKYVTKYIFKRCFDKLYHSWKSQGIGRSYVTDQLCHFLRSHLQDYIHLGGKLCYLPRYIRHIVFDDDQLAQLQDRYLLAHPIPEDSYNKRYYKCRWPGDPPSPITDFLGDRILAMQKGNQELYHLIKYGGTL